MYGAIADRAQHRRLIDFIDRDLNRLAVRTALAIGDREENACERIRALCLRRCPAERPGACIKVRAGRHAARTERECVGRQVRIRRRNRERERRAFVHCPVPNRAQHRILVHFIDLNLDRLAVAELRYPVVGHGNGHRVGARPLRFGRRPPERPGGRIDRRAQGQCGGIQRKRRRLPRIHVRRRGQETQRLQFIDRPVPDRPQHRRIVHRRHRDSHRGGIQRRQSRRILRLIGKAIRSIVVKDWRVRHSTIRVHHHAAMSRSAQVHRNQRQRPIHIRVVCHHIQGDECIFGQRKEPIKIRDRPFICVGHGDCDGLGIECPRRIAGLHDHVIDVIAADIGGVLKVRRCGETYHSGDDIEFGCISAANDREGDGVVIQVCRRDRRDQRGVLLHAHQRRSAAAIARDHRRLVGNIVVKYGPDPLGIGNRGSAGRIAQVYEELLGLLGHRITDDGHIDGLR